MKDQFSLLLICLVILIIAWWFILAKKGLINRGKDEAETDEKIAAIGEILRVDNTFLEYGTTLSNRERVLNILLRITDDAQGTREVSIDQRFRYYDTPQPGERYNILISVTDPKEIVIMGKIGV